ncbi:C40 family peptidase [Urechidicola vernalis]|uniref:C40 family peptidase n=1 Tax=Urechidicola vernalis TaxID=3075600 RepID=A0ABU2Y2Q3_9FLAO|nr:C40 family peptidase [Urechidicola sp. P050]MDT0552312.1 C40 family peptidase [Urechidicola sp. P050]
MLYGICNLSIVSLRLEPSDQSELISQVLFGEFFKVLERRTHWSKVRLAFDKFEGWIDNKQFIEITNEEYDELSNSEIKTSNELINFISDSDQNLTPIPLGASLPYLNKNILKIGTTDFSFEGDVTVGIKHKSKIIELAFMYLNSPYLWGGKTPFGIDCSGLTQMVYKLCGYKLLRGAAEQATQGEVLSFIEESEPGDLAFFDDRDGNIVHVGLIMRDNYIIHAHGKVRIDRIDHSGIYNIDTKRHTHKLRVIKKVI